MAKVQSLVYFVAQSTDLSQWKDYAEKVLGMCTSGAPGGGLYLKMDPGKYRILVVPGEADRYHASGWGLNSQADFDEAVAALKGAGVEVTPGSDAEKAQRCVDVLAKFTDPAGNLHELAYGYNGGTEPFTSPIGVAGFKTGEQGAGHTVLPMGAEPTPDIPQKFDATLKLFTEVLGFGLSDIFNFKPAPEAPNMRIYFLHAASGRHHSLALAEMPNPMGNVHVMVEVNNKEDVEACEKRREANGVKLMATMGQHENDKMTSFYMMTPGNFALEYGWGGITVDPRTWETTETKQVSIWGHDFSVGFK